MKTVLANNDTDDEFICALKEISDAETGRLLARIY